MIENGECRLGNLAFLNRRYWPISDAAKAVGRAEWRVADICSQDEDSGDDSEVRKRLTRLLNLPYVLIRD
jgi:hypothetical protein